MKDERYKDERYNINREFNDEELSMIWKKPDSHIVSDAEIRITNAIIRNWDKKELRINNILLEGDAGSGKTQIAKAISHNLRLPYTKFTCFSDMDKSDVLGSILPVSNSDGSIEYRYFPSEIVKAYENGWLLEIQEPTVIRDAAVLMALNSALEQDGFISLPDRIIKRHPDFVVIITTNRGYNGCRPINEALRDRVHHAEKLDLPPRNIMVDRAISKTGCDDENMLGILADAIISLDRVAKANSIKGVAGMRSYFYWVDAVMNGEDIIDSMYRKVIYKITTDDEEINILMSELKSNNILDMLSRSYYNEMKSNGDTINIKDDGDFEGDGKSPEPTGEEMVSLAKIEDSEGVSDSTVENGENSRKDDLSQGDDPFYHELVADEKQSLEEKKKFRRELNRTLREAVKGSIHEGIKMVVHRPEASEESIKKFNEMRLRLLPTIREITRRVRDILENEEVASFSQAKVYGTRFHADKVYSNDFKYFSRSNPPEEDPSLAVALRIDQSASMNSFGRMDAAIEAAVAVYEFCREMDIPVIIYGDTADRSRFEQMSVYSYVDVDTPVVDNGASIMEMKSISNNRDGMALKVVCDRLEKIDKKTKLLISISDGQPRAMPDYSGDFAIDDMKSVISEYERKGIIFVAAAIGQDKDMIEEIYGSERFLDIGNINELAMRLVGIIYRHMV